MTCTAATAHCHLLSNTEEQDSTLVFASQGHMRILYPGLLPFFYWALGDQPCPGFSHMRTDTCLRDLALAITLCLRLCPSLPRLTPPMCLSKFTVTFSLALLRSLLLPALLYEPRLRFNSCMCALSRDSELQETTDIPNTCKGSKQTK